ncbi:MAG TPA: RRQRL motif-containing zinc-binding protein [Mycobacteriales bacterium]|nr:RRQRL motif-containing zinc-binding protein [Mycobacteriales bacterium]
MSGRSGRRSGWWWVELWPGGPRELCRIEDGLPTFGFRQAPACLVTRRQLRAAGLRPNGQEPTGQLKWRSGRRWAALYRLDLAAPVRPASPAQLAALGRAMAARRYCRVHGGYVDHCVRGPERMCGQCFDRLSEVAA